jgi:hypothetical protein
LLSSLEFLKERIRELDLRQDWVIKYPVLGKPSAFFGGKMKNHRPFLRLSVLFFAILSITTCPLTSGGSLLNDGASASGLRQIDYTPELTPLLLPTIPTQSFGTEEFEQPEQPSFGADEEDVLLLQEIPDNGDPLDWIETIEGKWENVDVISCQGIEIVENCTQWTARELKLLHETLEEYILGDYLDNEISFIRAEDASWAGLMDPGIQEGILSAEIWIADSAWRMPPAQSAVDLFDYLFRKNTHFQSSIAHELTHAATWFHPELRAWWRNAKQAFEEAYGKPLQKGDWRLGFFYGWSIYDEFRDDEELYQRLIEDELFAMTVASIMYDPWWNQGTK